MEIFFNNPNEKPLPPEEVRIRELTAEPKAKGRQVFVVLEILPFQERPNAEISITNQDGNEVASANIIESMFTKVEMNIHLRVKPTIGKYTVTAKLFFLKFEKVPGTENQLRPLKPMFVDEKKTFFELTDNLLK